MATTRRRTKRTRGPRPPAARLAFEERQQLERDQVLRRDVAKLRREAETGLVELLAAVIRASEVKPMRVTVKLMISRPQAG